MKNRIQLVPTGKQADEYAINHPDAQRFTIVEHKAMGGICRWLAWIEGKWVPVGPVSPNLESAQKGLAFVGIIATQAKDSMLHQIQKTDELMKQFGLGRASEALGISDEEWVSLYNPDPVITEPGSVPVKVDMSNPPNHQN